MAEKQHISPIAASLDERAKNREHHFFDASEVFGPTTKIKGKIAIRVAMKSEEMEAIVASESYAKRIANGEDISDRDLRTDNRTLHVLWTTVRDGSSEEAARTFPAFESPAWMAQRLTNDEIARLLNLVNVVIARESPLETKLDVETVDRYIEGIGRAAGSDAANIILSRVDRAWLEQFVQLTCMRLVEHADAAKAQPLDIPQGFQFVPSE